MINKETEVFQFIAKGLRQRFKGIYVTGAELVDAPPKFPAVSLVQTNSITQIRYATFEGLENVVSEDYKAEAYSNLETGKETQTKEITMAISDLFKDLGYERTFCEAIPNSDPGIHRRVSRYRKSNVI